MDGNQIAQVRGRGGKREGAGRRGILKSVLADPKFAQARGINPLYASEILGHVVDERRAWQRVFNSEDDRIILQGLMFLVAMRDGKPAQRINVTSTSLQLNSSDLERARAIVAEIRGDKALLEREGASAEKGCVSNTVSLDMSKSLSNGADTLRLGTSQDVAESEHNASGS